MPQNPNSYRTTKDSRRAKANPGRKNKAGGTITPDLKSHHGQSDRAGTSAEVAQWARVQTHTATAAWFLTKMQKAYAGDSSSTNSAGETGWLTQKNKIK